MNIPAAAVEAAAEAIDQKVMNAPGEVNWETLATVAIEAAMPAIREAIAQEVEAAYDRPDLDLLAARIVRGGTP